MASGMFSSRDIFDWVDSGRQPPAKKIRYRQKESEYAAYLRKQLPICKVLYPFLPLEQIKSRIKAVWEVEHGKKNPRAKSQPMVPSQRATLKSRDERMNAQDKHKRKPRPKKDGVEKKGMLIKSAMKSVKGPTKAVQVKKKKDVSFATDLPRFHSRSASPPPRDCSSPDLDRSPVKRSSPPLRSGSSSVNTATQPVRQSRLPVKFNRPTFSPSEIRDISPSRSRSSSPVGMADSILLRSRSPSPASQPEPVLCSTPAIMEKPKKLGEKGHREEVKKDEHKKKDESDDETDVDESGDEESEKEETENESVEDDFKDDGLDEEDEEVSHQETNQEVEEMVKKMVKISVCEPVLMIMRKAPPKLSVCKPVLMTHRVVKPMETPKTRKPRTPDVVNKIVPLDSRHLFGNQAHHSRRDKNPRIRVESKRDRLIKFMAAQKKRSTDDSDRSHRHASREQRSQMSRGDIRRGNNRSPVFKNKIRTY